MRRLTSERHQVPLHPDCPAHGAGEATAVEQYGPLLDVELEVRDGSLEPSRRRGSAVEVDLARRQRVSQRDALGIAQVTDLVGVQRARASRRAEQAAAEPRPLLVGPVNESHPDRRRRSGSGELPDGLERGQQPERTVEPAAVGHGVDVRPDDHEMLLVGACDARPQVPGLVALGHQSDVGEL